jgi:hypothetical protein
MMHTATTNLYYPLCSQLFILGPLLARKHQVWWYRNDMDVLALIMKDLQYELHTIEQAC